MWPFSGHGVAFAISVPLSDEFQRGGESWEFLVVESSLVETNCDVGNRRGVCVVVEFVHGAQLAVVVIFHDVRVWLGFDLVDLHCGSLSGGGGGGLLLGLLFWGWVVHSARRYPWLYLVDIYVLFGFRYLTSMDCHI